MTTRVSVPVPDRVRAAAHYPDLVGLPDGASTAAIYERLLEYGYDAAVRARRQRQQLAAAMAYERDPERRSVAADLQRASLQRGVV
ncbi:MAG TPA: hypothetical protein VGA38_11010 [Candidatus Limnocylindria bacterium]